MNRMLEATAARCLAFLNQNSHAWTREPSNHSDLRTMASTVGWVMDEVDKDFYRDWRDEIGYCAMPWDETIEKRRDVQRMVADRFAADTRERELLARYPDGPPWWLKNAGPWRRSR